VMTRYTTVLLLEYAYRLKYGFKMVLFAINNVELVTYALLGMDKDTCIPSNTPWATRSFTPSELSFNDKEYGVFVETMTPFWDNAV